MVKLLILLTAIMSVSESHAQTPGSAAAPCADPVFRQMDFWVGHWDLSWTNADGSAGKGQNLISKDEYGQCVIYERFTSEQFKGMSVSTYHQPTGVWRQTWVDDTGGYFALSGGPVHGDSAVFELRNTRLKKSEPQLRMIWEKVTDESLIWRWQSLPPDADASTASWNDRWIIYYERID